MTEDEEGSTEVKDEAGAISMTEDEEGSAISTEEKDEAGAISMTEDEEGSTISTEDVKNEAGAISMTGRFSSMQVELQEAVDRKSQCDSSILYKFKFEGKVYIKLMDLKGLRVTSYEGGGLVRVK